ncbi:hypothetical protein IT779_22000 [Nocardia sp. NEAU-351]|uniref:Uncharacterized protein n=1 Tax=Nocardia bovistercoris TaxID=2785916 RepID=A0A931N1Z5_9NOCA|nr:hypothetical protein [Nocardia bovistercoris]
MNGAHAEHDSTGQPVLISLTAPPRRALADGLVRPVGSGAAHTVPRLDAHLPDPEVADFLATVVHTDTGFVARTDDGARVLAVIAATVAALCGEDIRTALTSPDIDFLRALEPPAVEALRGVLRAVETDHPDPVHAALGILAA